MTNNGLHAHIPGTMPEIPESVRNGIEYCLWSLEQNGVELRNGKTALYWHLISVLSQHIKMNDETKETSTMLGKHDYSGACSPDKDPGRHTTFSVGCFEWVPSKSKYPKKSAVKVRVRGSMSDPEAVYTRAREICEELDNGTYTGPKIVKV